MTNAWTTRAERTVVGTGEEIDLPVVDAITPRRLSPPPFRAADLDRRRVEGVTGLQTGEPIVSLPELRVQRRVTRAAGSAGPAACCSERPIAAGSTEQGA